MKRTLFIAAAAILALLSIAACNRYRTVKGDPMETRIYTLKNGLKVYMTVNKDEPRIQTLIAVRAGGKNDPADNTGLAHYLEHMMFKGTEQVGTIGYEAEKPLLTAIDSLFEVYRTKSDTAERLAIYHRIDSISYEASKLAIPNEYDKMMSLIGAQGTNAFTSNDVTCYTEDIPSNQVENWVKIEADRFKNCVFRGFHTELEAVYEEKNMGLTSDSRKAVDAIDSMLFARHPYGTQTVIGTQEHLKNPSLKAIRKQKDTYYVPNNVAICLSGDFDPDEMVALIGREFGDWQPNPDLPVFTYEPEEPLTAPKEKDVYGNDAEFVLLAWRTPGEKEMDVVGQIAASVLSNGKAGLLDLDINNAQELLYGEAFIYDRTDYDMLMLEGLPKEGQTLDEVRDILLREVAKLREGDFDESVITATVNNLKLREMRALENNRARAMRYVDSFVNGTSWKDEVGRIARLEQVTKADVVAWAGQYLGPESYALVRKYTGEDRSIKKIAAPRITPIVTNRDRQSPYLLAVQESEAEPIEPRFVDYGKDLERFQAEGLEVLYRQNVKNDIAQLVFRFDTGTATDPALALAADYLEYLGTPQRSADEIATSLYGLACTGSVRVGAYTTVITVSGLSENIGQALDIYEDLIRNAVGDEDVLASLKADELKSRADNKKNQQACNSALRRYVTNGPEYIRQTTLTDRQVQALTSADLLAKVKGLLDCSHRILYYGPETPDGLRGLLAEHHAVPADPQPLQRRFAPALLTPKPRVVIAHYPSRQVSYLQYSDRGETFDLAEAPALRLFNEYFGGGMNAIVFQEMRESRALAYSAGAYLVSPDHADGTYYFRATIGTQNDKLEQAVRAFDEIINDMPESEKNLAIAKASIESSIRTERHNGIDVLYSYLDAEDLGLSEPVSKTIYEHIGGLTMEDLMATQQKWVKDRTYVYALLGDTADLDLKFLRTLGRLQVVSSEEIFGY